MTVAVINNKIYQTHNGANSAYFSELWRIPEDRLLIVILGKNRLSDDLEEAVQDFIYAARGI